MGLFGNAQTNIGQTVNSNNQTEYNGATIVSTATTSLSSVTQQIALNQIPNFYGLPMTRFNVQINVTDTTGSTLPVTNSTSGLVNGASTSVYELIFYGQSGQPIIDMKGGDNDFINVAKLLNAYGSSQNDVSATYTTTSTQQSTLTFEQLISKEIPASEFPLNPVLILNTVQSRATTLNGLTSQVSVVIQADYEQASVVRTKLRSYYLTGITTGTLPVQAQLDKSVSVLAQGYYFASDSNLNTTNTFNFSNNGYPLINQYGRSQFISKENVLNPSNPHINGYYPLSLIYNKAWLSNPSTTLQFNVANIPVINGVSGVIKAHILEVY